MRNNIISQVGRDAKFTGDNVTGGPNPNPQTSAGVGPGAYDPRVTVSGTKDTMSARVEEQAAWGWSASFISNHIREMWLGWFGDNDELNSA